MEDKFETFEVDLNESMHQLSKKVEATECELQELRQAAKTQEDQSIHRKEEEELFGPEFDYRGYLETVKSKGAGKGKGLTKEKEVELRRSVTFGKYDDGILSSEIIQHLESLVEDEKDFVEEICARGRKWATTGVVKFKSEAAMWQYMKKHRGETGEFGGKTIYKEVAFVEGQDISRDRHIKKTKGACFEVIKDLDKEDLDVKFRSGVVKHKGHKLAHWDDTVKKMVFESLYADVEVQYMKLMGLE